jgi:hypothetical protein
VFERGPTPDQDQPRFFLKDKVEIPGRPYLGPAVERMRGRIQEEFGIFISGVFQAKG